VGFGTASAAGWRSWCCWICPAGRLTGLGGS